jgi:hypothetical protein
MVSNAYTRSSRRCGRRGSRPPLLAAPVLSALPAPDTASDCTPPSRARLAVLHRAAMIAVVEPVSVAEVTPPCDISRRSKPYARARRWQQPPRQVRAFARHRASMTSQRCRTGGGGEAPASGRDDRALARDPSPAGTVSLDVCLGHKRGVGKRPGRDGQDWPARGCQCCVAGHRNGVRILGRACRRVVRHPT